VPRGIGLIDDQGQYTLAVSSSSTSSGNFWRGACADGTNNYWGFSRTSSTYYFGFDQPGLVIQTDWSKPALNGHLQWPALWCFGRNCKTGVMRLPACLLPRRPSSR